MGFRVISEMSIIQCPEHGFWVMGIMVVFHGDWQLIPICRADTKEELIEARDAILDGIDNLFRLWEIIPPTPQLPPVVKDFLTELDKKEHDNDRDTQRHAI